MKLEECLELRFGAFIKSFIVIYLQLVIDVQRLKVGRRIAEDVF